MARAGMTLPRPAWGGWCECCFERAGAVENVQMRPDSRPLYGQTARKLLYYSTT